MILITKITGSLERLIFIMGNIITDKTVSLYWDGRPCAPSPYVLHDKTHIVSFWRLMYIAPIPHVREWKHVSNTIA